ncbi:MAG: alpha/beta fold hydrolase [Chloroflexi bacterium]|nr:alpha/beta fold hydrolase [Chloroflexota bacterium]
MTPRRRGGRYWFKLLSVGVIGGLVLAYLGFLILSVEVLMQPAPFAIDRTPLDDGFTYEDLTLKTADGYDLKGWYLPAQNGAAIILLHGYGGNRLEMLGRAEMLARHGFGVLLYDERGSGESGGMRTYGWLDAQDVALALSYLQNKAEIDPRRIGILGFSIGGQIALRAASQFDQISAIVAEEPGFARISDVPDVPTLLDKFYVIGYWLGEHWLSLRTGVPIPEGVIEGLLRIAPRPILFIAAGQEYGRLLVRRFFDRASEPKERWEVPETTHGGSPIARPDEYEHVIVGFFDRVLK